MQQIDVDEDEILALRTQVARLLDDTYSFRQRSEILSSPTGVPRQILDDLGALGFYGLLVPEEFGGSGLCSAHGAAIAEVFGRRLFASPFMSTAICAATLVAQGGTEGVKARMLSDIAAGRVDVALALSEPESGYDLSRPATVARQNADGFVLDGEKIGVGYAAEADLVLVLAQMGGAAGQRSVIAIQPGQDGVTLDNFRSHDGHRTSRIVLSGVQVGPEAQIVAPKLADRALAAAEDEATLFLAAEAVGCMWAAQEKTLAYLKERHQFGTPLASLQALQHRAVDMYIHCQLASALVRQAARCPATDPERRRAIRAAKYYVGRYGRDVGHEAVQLHGGIGITNEHDIGHYLKRLMLIDQKSGDARYHLRRYALAMPERSIARSDTRCIEEIQ